MPAQEGRPQKLVVLHDITDRKQAEITLEQTETLFRATLNLLPDAVVVIDPTDPDGLWPIIDCNEAACLMNGYRRDELIGHSIDILNVTSGTPAERSAYMQQLREAGSFHLETGHRHKDGSIFPVEVSTTLLTVGGRELVIGIDRDISERKRAEAEIVRQKQYFEAVVNNSPVAIVVLDQDEKIFSSNPAFESLFQYQETEIIGKNLDGLITTPDLSGSRSIYTASDGTGRAWDCETPSQGWLGRGCRDFWRACLRRERAEWGVDHLSRHLRPGPCPAGGGRGEPLQERIPC